MHKMCRLNDKLLNAVINCTLKSLIDIVDLLTISGKNVIDDDLCCECSAY